MDNTTPRIDLPALMRALKDNDEATAQNAGAMLGYYACHHEEHREAIAAQQENLIEPLTRHLVSKKNGLVHNAALLLGQCLRTDSEFRQVFASDVSAPRALVLALSDPDPGVVCNVVYAVRLFLADNECRVSTDLKHLVESALPALVAHSDARIKSTSVGIGYLLKQRHIDDTTISRDDPMQAVEALANIRNSPPTTTNNSPTNSTSSFEAVEALAALAVGMDESSPTGSQTSKPLPSSSPTLKTRSPKKSPRTSPTSRLAPWKKTMALPFNDVKTRKFHAAVTQAAAG